MVTANDPKSGAGNQMTPTVQSSSFIASFHRLAPVSYRSLISWAESPPNSRSYVTMHGHFSEPGTGSALAAGGDREGLHGVRQSFTLRTHRPGHEWAIFDRWARH